MSQVKTINSLAIVLFLTFAALSTIFAQTSFAQTALDTSKNELALAGGSEARSLFLQGKKYHDGDEVKQNFSKARALYIEAAELENNDARINLGYLYFMGQGVKQDYKQARHWYVKAAENGSKDAQVNLAMIYTNGLGVEKNARKAQYWRDYRAEKPKKALLITAKEKMPSDVAFVEKVEHTAETPKLLILPTEVIKPQIIASVTAPSNVKLENLRKPTLMLRKNSRQNTTAPVWMSNALIGALFALAFLSGIWFTLQYMKLRKVRQSRAFIRAFYAHHRDRLRTNYLRYPVQDRVYGHIDDLWAVALCVLMVKFAESQQDSRDLVGMQSRHVVKALKQGSLNARQVVFPFVERTQQKVLADIYANDCKPTTTFEPIRFPPKTKVKPVRKPKLSNVVALNAVRDKLQATIPPKSLWPDTTEV